MAWTVDYSATALKQLRALDKPLARRILDYLDERVIGSIEDGVMRVLVLQIGNRREVYRKRSTNPILT